jgi:flagellum-specific peptidoglycan hydrolase FlgJ
MKPAQALGLALLALGGAVVYSMSNKSVTVSMRLAFLKAFSPIALEVVRRNNWPLIVAPLLVAWAAMESAWGTSKLATEGFNVFGVKAGSTWRKQGSAYDEYVTHEHQGQKGYPPEGETIKAYFRHYESWAASLDDLLHMLSITNIYKPAFDALKRGDYQGFFQAIDASGYSTAKNYSDRIKNFVSDVGGMA